MGECVDCTVGIGVEATVHVYYHLCVCIYLHVDLWSR